MVPLSKSEYKLIKKLFGKDKIVEIKGRYFLVRREDGSCIFLINNICSIQNYKPLACKLWPFYVYRKPLRDRDKKLAIYSYKEEVFYIYVDPSCKGLNKGFTPISEIIKEAVKLYVGEQRKQVLTTHQTILTKKYAEHLILQIDKNLIVKRPNLTNDLMNKIRNTDWR